mmetsp:Transcript_38443/g.84300  ORF Transcript_38443/g.84300 Transcript_38443/m.84300 type:complete len:289 (-) Transcript_38443:158-1024(-)
MARDAVISWLAAAVRRLERRVQELEGNEKVDTEKTYKVDTEKTDEVDIEKTDKVNTEKTAGANTKKTDKVDTWKTDKEDIEKTAKADTKETDKVDIEKTNKSDFEKTAKADTEKTDKAGTEEYDKVDIEKADKVVEVPVCESANEFAMDSESETDSEKDSYEELLEAYTGSYEEMLEVYAGLHSTEVWQNGIKGLENMGNLTFAELHEQIVIAVLPEIDVKRDHMFLPTIYEMVLKLIVKRWASFNKALGTEAYSNLDKFCDVLTEDVKEIVKDLIDKGRQRILSLGL